MLSISNLRRFATALALALALGITGCGGGDDSDTPSAACERADECNLLAGISQDECIEEVENDLDSLTESQRDDWATLMEGCLEFETCTLFTDCVASNGL